MPAVAAARRGVEQIDVLAALKRQRRVRVTPARRALSTTSAHQPG